MKKYCEHEDCKVDTLEELAKVLEKFPWREDIREAMHEVPNSQVRCRHVPKKALDGSGSNVPLPPLKSNPC